GTTSSDPDGDALTYAWTQTVGTSVTINNASGAIATFTAPPEQYPNGETLTFMLTVSDGSLSGSTTVNVTVNSVNQPPVAAILSQCPFSVNEGASVTLDGSGSSDPDLGVLQYQWNQVQGIPNADLTEVDLAQPSISFTAPQLISSLNMMKFGLTVTDNGGLKNDAECEIVVIDVTPPSIECPDFDDTIWYGDNVAVNCSASDVASGLADDTLNSFTLTTSVSAGTETDSALTNSEEVCDKANNCRTAGPYAFKIDKKAPTVICDTADIAWHATDQSVTCTVTDGGSGPASPTLTLSTSVPVGTETSDASTESKSAYDNVGNSATVGPVSGFKI
ncbi:MAG TPA: Ig-like domain-containing protein, partial [Saprospiraceae bacterium]|nr:Ig-like domain-containing protein [Saprospiraceae bacterium]